MLEPLRVHASHLARQDDWPDLASMQALVSARAIGTAGGAPLRLVSDADDTGYETRIRTRGEMHVRSRDWHDLFNVLVWRAYPRTKAALNDVQFAALREESLAAHAYSGRGPVRDALTLFDESGLIVLSSERSLLADLKAFRWKRLFWERRDEVLSSMRFFVFGHALFEKALRPYVGMTAHALLFSMDAEGLHQPLPNVVETADALASTAMSSITTPRALSPVPVLGIPGWWAANADPEFYDNEWYFRKGRTGCP